MLPIHREVESGENVPCWYNVAPLDPFGARNSYQRTPIANGDVAHFIQLEH